MLLGTLCQWSLVAYALRKTTLTKIFAAVQFAKVVRHGKTNLATSHVFDKGSYVPFESYVQYFASLLYEFSCTTRVMYAIWDFMYYSSHKHSDT